jgi:hypothetical protein
MLNLEVLPIRLEHHHGAFLPQQFFLQSLATHEHCLNHHRALLLVLQLHHHPLSKLSHALSHHSSQHHLLRICRIDPKFRHVRQADKQRLVRLELFAVNGWWLRHQHHLYEKPQIRRGKSVIVAMLPTQVPVQRLSRRRQPLRRLHQQRRACLPRRLQ